MGDLSESVVTGRVKVATPFYALGIDVATNYKVVAVSREKIIKLVRSYGMFKEQ